MTKTRLGMWMLLVCGWLNIFRSVFRSVGEGLCKLQGHWRESESDAIEVFISFTRFYTFKIKCCIPFILGPFQASLDGSVMEDVVQCIKSKEMINGNAWYFIWIFRSNNVCISTMFLYWCQFVIVQFYVTFMLL